MFVIPSPAEIGIEEALTTVVLWVKIIVEMVGALLITLGVANAAVSAAHHIRRQVKGGYERTRLVLARFLSLGLEFQLAADILATIVSPTWPQIGELAAIAAIRTALNFFLAREMKEAGETVHSTENLLRGDLREHAAP
jgi:uncharacterized membrane protein